MNRIITTETGGHPLTLNDFTFMQNMYSEVLNGILSGLANSANKGYILSGCSIYTDAGTGTLWVTEGYVVIKFGLVAEVFYCPNHDLGVSSLPDPYWLLSETNVAPSPVVYKDGTSKNVHKQRRVTLAASTTLFFPKLSETPQWVLHLEERLISTDWYQVGSAGSPAYQTNWVVGAYPLKFKKQFGEVSIIGSITNASYTNVTNQVIFILPVGFRPAQKVFYRGWDVSQANHSLIEIETNGEVKYSVPGVSISAGSVSANFDGWCRFHV